MNSITWRKNHQLFASALVDPVLPIRMTFHFFPKDRVNEPTDKGRIGDLDPTNDIVRIPPDDSLQNDPNPFLTFVATVVGGRTDQTGYDFYLVFFDEENKTRFDNGTPLEELDHQSTVNYRGPFPPNFVIIDDPLWITYVP